MYSLLPDRVLDRTVPQVVLAGSDPRARESDIEKLRLRYDENVRYADGEIGRFLEVLKPGNAVVTAVALRSAPARLFAQVDAQRRLAYDLVGKQWVGGVEAAAAHIPIQPLQLAAPVHAGSSGHRQR